MQSATFRPALRVLTRSTPASQSSRQALRRRYATEAPGEVTKGDSTRSVPPQSSNKLPFIIGGLVIFGMVAGRYILASDKPAGSGNAEQLAEKRAGNYSGRDARDSPVKTLEQQKQQKEQKN